MNALTRITSACLALAVIFIAGCGGGSDGGVVTPPTTPPPTGGITRTGIAFAEGPITGFGSVIVNGVSYDTSSATFTKDGEPATQDDFSVGQVVLIKGTIDDNNGNAAADTVEFNDAVEGPVSSVDLVANSIDVLGQTVLITATTSIDDSCPDSLAGLLTVPAVEVSGLPNANGDIDASRIECRDGTWDGVMEVNGIVSAHNASAMTFMINALVVDYSSTMAIDNFPTAGIINDGDPVEAKGSTLGASDELIATRVEYKGARFGGDAGDHLEIEGFITRFGTSTDFDVSGINVTTTGTTNFEGGVAGDLGLNLKVEVEGEFDAAGVLVATKVEIKTATAIRATGRLDSVSGNTLVILGITVNTESIKTRFEDKSNADVDPMTVADLNVNDYVEIRGQEQPTGQITAFIVEREDPDDSRIELRGFVTATSEPNLTVFGVTVVTSGSTVYRDSRGGSDIAMSSVDFWAAVSVGDLVDGRGTETDPTTLTVEELSLED